MGERSEEAGSKFVVYDKEGRLLLSWVFPPPSPLACQGMQETPKATREEEERRRTDSHRHAVCTVSFSFAAKERLAKRLSPKIGR